jgi:hypothetical protein
MKFEKRSDIESWISTGGCPFYFHELPPRCAVTRMALSGKDVFDDDEERDVISSFDCRGDMHICPYVSAMWNLEDPTGEDTDGPPMMSQIIIPEFDIEIEVADHITPRSDGVVVIPTTSMGLWENMGWGCSWSDETRARINAELSMFEKPLPIGWAVVTDGHGSGYDSVIHAVIFDDVNNHGLMTTDVHSAVSSALSVADEIPDGVTAIDIRPMCIPLPDGEAMPSLWHAINIPITSLFSFLQAGRLSSYRSFRIEVVPRSMDMAMLLLGELSTQVVEN